MVRNCKLFAKCLRRGFRWCCAVSVDGLRTSVQSIRSGPWAVAAISSWRAVQVASFHVHPPLRLFGVFSSKWL